MIQCGQRPTPWLREALHHPAPRPDQGLRRHARGYLEPDEEDGKDAAECQPGTLDTTVVEIDPGPFELEDLRHSGCKLELQPDSEEDERVF